MGYDSLKGSREKIRRIKQILVIAGDLIDVLEQDLIGRTAEMEMTNANTAKKSIDTEA